jgi:RimJ/RimL family protein N-acetyltransferase
MRHELSFEGPAFRIRPVLHADAAFIVALRNDPSLSRFIHGGAVNVEQQQQWLARYDERPGDYYFVIERRAGAAPEGLIALYDLDDAARRAEWGRWILQPRSLAAVESAWLVYRCAFERLGLDEVYCRTVADNTAVVSFHDSCGLSDRRLLPGQFHFGERVVDAVEHRLPRSGWPAVSEHLHRIASLTARRLNRG